MSLLRFLRNLWRGILGAPGQLALPITTPPPRPGPTQTAPSAEGPTHLGLTPEEQAKVDKVQELINAFCKHLIALKPSTTPRAEIYAQVQALRTELVSTDDFIAQAGNISWKDREELVAVLDNLEIGTQPLFAAQRDKSTLVAVIDTETTGLGEKDEPISVGIVLLEVSGRKGELIEEIASYYGLREPSVPITPQAQAVHGIDISELRGKQLDLVRLRRLLDSSAMLIAHNAKFDRRMMSKIVPHLMRANWACSIYTLKDDWRDLGDGQRSLDAICTALSIERPSPHNSLSDCRALVSVLKTRAGDGRSSTRIARLIRNAWAPPA